MTEAETAMEALAICADDRMWVVIDLGSQTSFALMLSGSGWAWVATHEVERLRACAATRENAESAVVWLKDNCPSLEFAIVTVAGAIDYAQARKWL